VIEPPILDDDLQPINPIIAAALERGEDATGLCTVRECVETIARYGYRETDMCFEMDGRSYVVRVQILQVTTK